MKKRQPKVIDAQTGAVFDVDPTPPQIKLGSIAEVRRELARVYRDARGGLIETSDGTKLAFILTGIAKMIETSELEQRIENLERANHGNN